MSSLEFHITSSAERLLRTAFWTLWVVVVVFTSYGYAAEFFGLSLFGRGYAPKYHMGAEAHVIGTISLFAMLMLAATSLGIRRFSRTLFRLGILACAYQFIDILIPRF
jgi:hypothetical protein